MSGVAIYAVVLGCFSLIVVAFLIGYERGHHASHENWMRQLGDRGNGVADGESFRRLVELVRLLTKAVYGRKSEVGRALNEAADELQSEVGKPR